MWNHSHTFNFYLSNFPIECVQSNFVVSNLQLNWISFVWEVQDLNWKLLQVSPLLKFGFWFPVQQLWWSLFQAYVNHRYLFVGYMIHVIMLGERGRMYCTLFDCSIRPGLWTGLGWYSTASRRVWTFNISLRSSTLAAKHNIPLTKTKTVFNKQIQQKEEILSLHSSVLLLSPLFSTAQCKQDLK